MRFPHVWSLAEAWMSTRFIAIPHLAGNFAILTLVDAHIIKMWALVDVGSIKFWRHEVVQATSSRADAQRSVLVAWGVLNRTLVPGSLNMFFFMKSKAPRWSARSLLVNRTFSRLSPVGPTSTVRPNYCFRVCFRPGSSFAPFWLKKWWTTTLARYREPHVGPKASNIIHYVLVWC